MTSCEHCIHHETCKFKEDYQIFVDEVLNEPFDLMPKFLDIQVSCKYYNPNKAYRSIEETRKGF